MNRERNSLAIEALRELVELKALKDALDALDPASEIGAQIHQSRLADYQRRKPMAWQRAREVLSGAPSSKECTSKLADFIEGGLLSVQFDDGKGRSLTQSEHGEICMALRSAPSAKESFENQIPKDILEKAAQFRGRADDAGLLARAIIAATSATALEASRSLKDAKDAARYRFLQRTTCGNTAGGKGSDEECYLSLNASDMDAAIDAAMRPSTSTGAK